MTVLGLVSIPGLMTGQILSGYPPEQAAKYQIMIYLLVCANSSFAAIMVFLLACRHLFDSSHRLLSQQMLTKRVEKADDVLVSILKPLSNGIHHVLTMARGREISGAGRHESDPLLSKSQSK